MSDTQPNPNPGGPADGPEPEPTPTTGSSRFAQYDRTLQRFVGGVVDKRSGVDKSLRVKGHNYEVREV